MNKEKMQYWLYIETYVHISLKRESILLYNTLSGKALEYSGNEKILNLVRNIKSPKNLQVYLVTEEMLNDPEIFQFINDVRRYFMGDLLDASYSKGKPVQMMPIIKIQKDVNYLKKQDNRSIGEDLAGNLDQIFLYLNNECLRNCDICSVGYKQFPCCTTGKGKKRELEIAKIKKLLEEASGCILSNLNILGGNIFRYSKFKELVGIINHFPARKVYFAHYFNIAKEAGRVKFLNPKSSLVKILVSSPVVPDPLKAARDILKSNRLESKFVFLIQSEEEFEKAEAIISVLSIEDYDYQPWYNGKNLEFFRENIFTTKEEILESKPAMKEIYANSVVNSLNFGRLTVFSNGHIHANANASRLGILGKDSLYDALYKEMSHGRSWRRIRKSLEPCNRCTFEALCPPIPNYTYTIGRNNLCHTNFALTSLK